MIFSEGVHLSNSYYETNKIIMDLDFTYKTWDACPNNCMLFRGKDEGRDKCQICQVIDTNNLQEIQMMILSRIVGLLQNKYGTFH